MADEIELDQFADNLGLGPREHIALVGGGGKTTLLHALGSQLQGRVLMTTTTRMAADQDGGFPVVTPADDPVARCSNGPVLVWSKTESDKAYGVATSECDRWAGLVDYVIVEADGSRQRPFKAPTDFEPVVPATTTQLISVIGADALGRVIADQCHRPLRVAALAGCSPYRRLSPANAATVLLHDRGARRAAAERTRFLTVVTKVDKSNQDLVAELISELQSREADLLVIAIRSTPDATRGRPN